MKSFNKYKIYPLGESAVTVDFGNEFSVGINDFVINLANRIEKENFKGFIESVPAYSSLTIFYDVLQVRKNYGDLQFVENFIKTTIEILPKANKLKSKTIEIPVSFDIEFALDLEFVAEFNNLKRSEVIKIFLSKTYRVFMLGFLPGFAYMGELDERIGTPRKQTPRTKVSKGSVGIAGLQTGIYPLESPGGWQIIGKTNVELFTPNEKHPTLFQTGDSVKFTEIK